MNCLICGIEERDEESYYSAGNWVTSPPVKLRYKGCCSQDCARTLMLVRAQMSVSMQLMELIVATAVEQNYVSGDSTFEDVVMGILEVSLVAT